MGAIVMLKPRRHEGAERSAAPASQPAPVSDGTLVERARQGDESAKEALFRRHVRGAWTLALRLVARRPEAEDVVQDAFVIALGELHRLQCADAFGGWLSTIVVRQAHRHFRRRRLRRIFGLDRGADEGVLEALSASDASQEQILELARVDATLRTIDERARSAWVLRHVEGRTLVEVADACGCSLATAKRRLAIAERAIASVNGEDGAHAREESTRGAR